MEVSEHQLQRELDLPRGGRRRVDDSGRGTVVVTREHNLIRVREIGVIENIERLGTELQIHFLINSYLLEQRSIDREQPGTTE